MFTPAEMAALEGRTRDRRAAHDPPAAGMGHRSRAANGRVLRTVPLLALAERGLITDADAVVTHEWCRLVERAVLAGDGPRLSSPSWTRAGGGHGGAPMQVVALDVRQRVSVTRQAAALVAGAREALAVCEMLDSGRTCTHIARELRLPGRDRPQLAVVTRVRQAAGFLMGGV